MAINIITIPEKRIRYIGLLFQTRWNECFQSDKTFVTPIRHLCKANVMAMHEIKVQPDATFGIYILNGRKVVNIKLRGVKPRSLFQNQLLSHKEVADYSSIHLFP